MSNQSSQKHHKRISNSRGMINDLKLIKQQHGRRSNSKSKSERKNKASISQQLTQKRILQKHQQNLQNLQHQFDSIQSNSQFVQPNAQIIRSLFQKHRKNYLNINKNETNNQHRNIVESTQDQIRAKYQLSLYFTNLSKKRGITRQFNQFDILQKLMSSLSTNKIIKERFKKQKMENLSNEEEIQDKTKFTQLMQKQQTNGKLEIKDPKQPIIKNNSKLQMLQQQGYAQEKTNQNDQNKLQQTQKIDFQAFFQGMRGQKESQGIIGNKIQQNVSKKQNLQISQSLKQHQKNNSLQKKSIDYDNEITERQQQNPMALLLKNIDKKQFSGSQQPSQAQENNLFKDLGLFDYFINQIKQKNEQDNQKLEMDPHSHTRREKNNNFFDPQDPHLTEEIRKFLKQKTKFYTNALISQQMSDEQMKVAFSQDILKRVLGNIKVGTMTTQKKQKDKESRYLRPLSLAIKYEDENIKYLKLVQNCLKQSIKYLKIVYPRNTKMQARNELINEIKDIDLTHLVQFDMMAQTDTLFHYQNQQFDSGIEILDQIKYFLQKINNQSKIAYPNFEHILKQLIPKFIKTISTQDKKNQQQDNLYLSFTPIRNFSSLAQSQISVQDNFSLQQKDSQYMEILTDPHKFKIGKKLSPDDKHFESPGSQRLRIQTNQLFRLMTKWTQDLMDMLEQFRTNTQGFFVKKFSEIQCKKHRYFNHYYFAQNYKENQVCKKVIHLRQKIQKHVFDKGQDELRNSLAQMLKIVQNNRRFGELEPSQKKMLSFSKKTYEMLRQFLEQQLLFLIKSLTDIRYQMNRQWEPSVKNIDFVRFKVTDLLRARIMVGQKLLMDIYKALVAMDETQIIKIVKIKNRFKTPMSDALIIFKMIGCYKSPVLCELQLILYKKQGDDNKEKAYETMNHFLYEMERSTYGPLSELSLLVALKDPRIQYLKLIQLDKSSFFDQCFCPSKKFMQSVESQKKFSDFKIIYQPQERCINTKSLKSLQSQIFTCSRCEETLGKNENLFPIKSCICGYKICSQCIIECEPNLYKELIQKIMNTILFARTEDGNNYQFEFGNDKSPKTVVDCDHNLIIFTSKSKKDKFWKQVQTHILKKEKINIMFGILLRLSKFLVKEEKPFFVYKIQKTVDNIYFMVDNSEEKQKFTIQEMKNVKKFDTFVFIKENIIKDRNKTFQQLTKKSITNNIIKNCLFKQFKKTQIQKLEDQISQKFKEQLKSDFARTLSLIEDHISNFNFLRKAIRSNASNIEKIKRLKIVNLQSNNIQCVEGIFTEFLDLQQLYLDNNKISQFKIKNTEQYPNLKTISLNENILSILRIQNHRKITNIFVKRNNSMVFNEVVLRNNPALLVAQLAQIYPRIIDLQLQQLENLQVFNFTNYDVKDLDLIYQFKALQEICLQKTNIKMICSSNRIKKILLRQSPNIYFQRDAQDLIIFDMSWDISYLFNLQVLQIWSIQQINYLKLPKTLKKLHIQNVERFLIPLNLSNIKLQEVYFKKMPLQVFIFLPKMREVILDKVKHFQSIKQEENGSKNLRKLHIMGLQLDGQTLKELKIKSESLLELNLQQNNIKSIKFLEKISLNSLKKLQLQKNCIEMDDNALIQIKLNKLKIFNLYSNDIASLKFLENMELTSLQDLNLEFNKLSHGYERPNFTISLNKLTKLNLNSNCLTSIKFLQGMQLQQLVTLLIDDNYIGHNDQTVIRVELNNLQKLSLFSNKIISLKFLQQMRLQSLVELELSSNCISHDQKSKLNYIDLKNLQKLNLQHNQITSLFFLEKINLDSLQELNLSHNKINHNENTYLFIQLKSLQKFNLSYNQITSLKFLEGISLKYLCELQLEKGNNIMDNENSKFLIKMPNLQKLNLAQKSISSLCFLQKMKLDSLVYLYLQKNKIYHDMDSVLSIKLRNLQRLNLSQNCISSLKFLQGIQLPSLIDLKLWKNQIWHDDNIYLQINLKSLRSLNLSSNQLTSLSFLEGMKMDSLLTLILWNNKIAHDDKSILSIQLQNLKYLGLQKNKIMSLKFLEGMKMTSLVELNLGMNKITYNEKISLNIKLKKLEILLLFQNQFHNLNFLLKMKLNSLVYLHLGSNKIVTDESTNLPVEFQKLKVMILTKNQIKSMAFLKDMVLSSLQQLILSNNYIKKLELLSFPKLQKLAIYGNQFENIEEDIKIIRSKLYQNRNIVGKILHLQIDKIDQQSEKFVDMDQNPFLKIVSKSK